MQDRYPCCSHQPNSRQNGLYFVYYECCHYFFFPNINISTKKSHLFRLLLALNARRLSPCRHIATSINAAFLFRQNIVDSFVFVWNIDNLIGKYTACMAGVMTTQPDVVIRYIVSDIRQHFSILQVFRFPCVVSKPKRKVRMRTNRWIHFGNSMIGYADSVRAGIHEKCYSYVGPHGMSWSDSTCFFLIFYSRFICMKIISLQTHDLEEGLSRYVTGEIGHLETRAMREKLESYISTLLEEGYHTKSRALAWI